MIFDLLTIFPDLLESPLNESIIRRARQAGQVRIDITNIREFAEDKHSMTDDRPFGGGEGMVMKPEPLTAALQSVRKKRRGTGYFTESAGTPIQSGNSRRTQQGKTSHSGLRPL